MGQIIGKTDKGEDIVAYEISGGILKAKIMNFGANLMELHVKMADGSDRDVVLGYNNIEDYFDNDPNYGCTVARCANRIGGAEFTIDGEKYTLEKNDNGKNNLHSGKTSLQRRLWKTVDEAADHVSFTYHSPDGDLGFPGNLDITVTYTIKDNAVIIDYKGISDKKTILNPTNHSYFNLKGEGNGDILDTQVQINADEFTHSDAESIPDGQLIDVTGTPMDFRTYHSVGERVDADYEALNQAGGYDHNYVLKKTDELRAPEFDHDDKKEYEAAKFKAADDSIEVSVYTDLPGLQFYSGNYISGHDLGKCGKMYPRRGGVAFETQFFPNAINVPTFDQPVIEAGKTFATRTVYKFLAK